MTVSYREYDQRQDKKTKENHLAQGEDHRQEVEESVLLRAQHIDKPKESPRCRQNQGVAQDEADGRAAHERCCDASELGAEHGPDDHEEDRDYVHVTAHVLPQCSIASGNDYLQQVRPHCDMSGGANTRKPGPGLE